jgi:hypothetical protein
VLKTYRTLTRILTIVIQTILTWKIKAAIQQISNTVEYKHRRQNFMDNVFWVVIAASVMIALGGIVLYIGGGSLGDSVDNAESTSDDAVCSFQQNEVDSGRATCGEDIVSGDRCYDQVCS